MADLVTPPEFHTPQETIEILRLKNTKTLERMERRGEGPPRLKIGAKTILYPRQELLTWLYSHQTVADPHPKKKRGRPRKGGAEMKAKPKTASTTEQE